MGPSQHRPAAPPEKVLNIKTLDRIYLHYGENGIDDIALPPLGPDNFESINTDAVANIDINIEDAWKTYSETENKRTITVAIIDTGIDTTHSDLKIPSGSMKMRSRRRH